jgi:hypothetical protein
MMADSVYDRWLVRRLPRLLAQAGLEPLDQRGHSFVETQEPDYLLTIVDRGADKLERQGDISPATAGALKAEARDRVEHGTFVGHIAYAD